MQKCWKDEFSFHVGGLNLCKFFGVYYLKVWDVAPCTLFLVSVRVALCVYAVQRKSLGMLRSKKGQGLKEVDSCRLAPVLPKYPAGHSLLSMLVVLQPLPIMHTYAVRGEYLKISSNHPSKAKAEGFTSYHPPIGYHALGRLHRCF